MIKQWFVGFTLLALLLPAAALAEQKGSVQLLSIAEVEIKVKNAEGIDEIKRVPAASTNVAPGDIVIFTNNYINNGDKPADSVVITNPVPTHMTYVDGSAIGETARIEFSLDKGKSYGAPESLIFNDGKKERPARPDDYTHVRWTLEKSVPPAGSGNVAFRAKVK